MTSTFDLRQAVLLVNNAEVARAQRSGREARVRELLRLYLRRCACDSPCAGRTEGESADADDDVEERALLRSALSELVGSSRSGAADLAAAAGEVLTPLPSALEAGGATRVRVGGAGQLTHHLHVSRAALYRWRCAAEIAAQAGGAAALSDLCRAVVSELEQQLRRAPPLPALSPGGGSSASHARAILEAGAARAAGCWGAAVWAQQHLFPRDSVSPDATSALASSAAAAASHLLRHLASHGACAILLAADTTTAADATQRATEVMSTFDHVFCKGEVCGPAASESALAPFAAPALAALTALTLEPVAAHVLDHPTRYVPPGPPATSAGTTGWEARSDDWAWGSDGDEENEENARDAIASTDARKTNSSQPSVAPSEVPLQRVLVTIEKMFPRSVFIVSPEYLTLTRLL